MMEFSPVVEDTEIIAIPVGESGVTEIASVATPIDLKCSI